MAGKDDFQSVLDKIHVDDIKAQIDVPVSFNGNGKEKNESSPEIGFRPLSAEEKKKIQNLLDAHANK